MRERDALFRQVQPEANASVVRNLEGGGFRGRNSPVIVIYLRKHGGIQSRGLVGGMGPGKGSGEYAPFPVSMKWSMGVTGERESSIPVW